MFKKLLIALAFILTPAVAMACPQISGSGAQLYYSGGDLWAPKAHSVIAGGSENLSYCNIRTGNAPPSPVGYVAVSPDFELHYTGGNYSLEFRVVSECDSVLLINTGGANWYFDDDDNGAGDAKIRLTRPSTGLYDIWIGTYGPNTCNARLELETF